MEMNVARSESVVPVTAWSSLQVHRHRRGADERGERIGDADHLELVLAGGAQGAADVEGVPTSTPRLVGRPLVDDDLVGHRPGVGAVGVVSVLRREFAAVDDVDRGAAGGRADADDGLELSPSVLAYTV